MLKPVTHTLLRKILQVVLGKAVSDFEDSTLPRHVHCSCSLDLGHGVFVFQDKSTGIVTFFFFSYWADVDPGGCLYITFKNEKTSPI